jgi:hypothetical protein
MNFATIVSKLVNFFGSERMKDGHCKDFFGDMESEYRDALLYRNSFIQSWQDA